MPELAQAIGKGKHTDMDRWLSDLIEKQGLNPVYTSAVVLSLIVVVVYRRDFLNWSRLPGYKKRFVLSLVFTSIVLLIVSLLDILKG